MKNNVIQQELLLVITSSFSQGIGSTRNDVDGKHHVSPAEFFEEACLSGLLYKMFPEIMINPADGIKFCLWHSRKSTSSLLMGLTELPFHYERQYSIEPKYFMGTVIKN